MTSLFTSIDCPSQLDSVCRVGVPADHFETGLKNLGYYKDSPGWKAVLVPMTPMDKAFQIYALNMVIENKFGPEIAVYTSEDNKRLWDLRDKCWKMAADWVLSNTDILNGRTKEQQRDIKKIMPEALRIQASHELPPGPWEIFPRDATSQKKSALLHELTDRLQHLGLNLKIQASAQAMGESLNNTKNMAYYKEYGSLETLCSYNNEKEQQPELF